MGVLARLFSIVRGESDSDEAGTRTLLAPAVARQLVDNVTAQVDELQSELAHAMASERRLRADIDDQVALARDWMTRAELAAEAYDEPSATEALHQQRQHQFKARSLEKERIGQLAAMTRLRSQLDQAEAWLTHLQEHGPALAESESSPTDSQLPRPTLLPLDWPGRETVH